MNGMQPKGWSGKRFCKNVCNLETGSYVEKIELLTFKLLFQPFEVDVLCFVHVSHGCWWTGGHDCDSRLVVLHKFDLIKFRETGFEGVDIRSTTTCVDVPITDFVNFGVDPSEHNIFLGLRGVASWFTLKLLEKIQLLKQGQHWNALGSHAVICGNYLGLSWRYGNNRLFLTECI